MPSATTRRLYEDQIPSFMSVFGHGAEAMGDQDTVTVVDPKILGFRGASLNTKPFSNHAHTQSPAPPVGAAPSTLPRDHVHRHHDSTSTQASGSAESSPTTTMSCTDSSSLSDPSPSSSPDSPVNMVPLAALPGPSFGGFSSMSASLASLSVDGAGSRNGLGSGLRFNNRPDGAVRPMTSPAPRRARNMKGLSIQPPFVSPSLSSSQGSEPSSPSFIKPQLPAMKRKPSQLSLKTGSHELIASTTIEVPQSPSLSMPPIMQRRALKHSSSSPHMLSSLQSATFGPAGGMTFSTVLERDESGLSKFLRPAKPIAGPVGYDSTILEEDSPIRTQIASRAAYEFEPFHDNEKNEDQKTPGYPDGPIAIYGDNVYLYLEPTAEEAARFDVVINVAREVQNPFTTTATKSQQQQAKAAPAATAPAAPAAGAVLEPVMEHEPESTEAQQQDQPAKSKRKLNNKPASLSLHPETTKAPLKEPEYIHMPWDHNTDISQDLIMLCEQIERKTRAGKKVLIHCQQGASRSASLIIAYGIWQNPEMSVNDAYYAAQSKSKWISPNMRLMYCLQDFQKEMGKKRQPSSSLLRPRPGRSPTKHRGALSVDAIDLAPKEPLSAPLPAEDSASAANTLSAQRGPMRPRGNSTPPSRDGISPGPSSAPSAFSWDMEADAKDAQSFGRFNFGTSSSLSSSSSMAAPPQQPLIRTEAPSPGSPLKMSLPPMSSFSSSFGLHPNNNTLSLPSDRRGSDSSKPPSSPGFAPMSLSLPGHGSDSSSKPPPSPGFAPMTLSLPGRGTDSSKPPPSPGFAPMTLSLPGRDFSSGKPPKSPGFAPMSLSLPGRDSDSSKPPPSPGFAPKTLSLRDRGSESSTSKPPPSPGFAPMTLSLPGRGSDASKPPPSPGFAAHRFGKFNITTTTSSTTHSSTNSTDLSGFPLRSPGFPRPRSSCSGGLDSILAQNMGSSAAPHPQPLAIPKAHSTIEKSVGDNRSSSSKVDTHEHTISFRPAYPVEEPLMSPRAETMTSNPLRDNLADMSGMRFVEVPPTPSEGLFSPREAMFPRDPFSAFGRPTQVTDPRSPPTKGESPIVRSIDEFI